MCAETGHLEHVPEDTRDVFTRDSVPLPDHKSHATPERAHKASASPLPAAVGQQLSSVQIMLDFPKDPVFPELHGLSSGHQPCIVEHSSGFKRVSNVAIRDNRNGNFLLNCPNTVVLSVSVKQAGAGASVNSQSLNATLFGQLGNLYAVTVFGSQPVRILRVTGTSTALTTAVRIDFTVGVLQEAEPASLRFTFSPGIPY